MGNDIKFFQTQMGHKFYERDVPRLVQAMEVIAHEMKRANDMKEKELNAGTVKGVAQEFVVADKDDMGDGRGGAG